MFLRPCSPDRRRRAKARGSGGEPIGRGSRAEGAIGKTLKIALLSLPFLFVFLATTEIYLRYFATDAALYRDNACIQKFQFEHPRWGTKSRRLFKPNCKVEVGVPGSPAIELKTNEDGFRDRPRGEFAGGAFAVIGDSHVEGLGLAAEDTLGRQLEVLGAGVFHEKILNLGFRAGGSHDATFFLKRALSHYKIDGVVWLLTENDLVDDQLRASREGYGLASLLSRPVYFLSTTVFHRSWVTLEYLQVLLHVSRLDQANDEARRKDIAMAFCRSVRSVQESFTAPVPIYVVAIPHGIPSENLHYFGLAIDHESFGSALKCIGEAPLKLIDLREQFVTLEPYLLKDRYHLNAEGMKRLAAMIVGGIKSGAR